MLCRCFCGKYFAPGVGYSKAPQKYTCSHVRLQPLCRPKLSLLLQFDSIKKEAAEQKSISIHTIQFSDGAQRKTFRGACRVCLWPQKILHIDLTPNCFSLLYCGYSVWLAESEKGNGFSIRGRQKMDKSIFHAPMGSMAKIQRRLPRKSGNWSFTSEY